MNSKNDAVDFMLSGERQIHLSSKSMCISLTSLCIIWMSHLVDAIVSI